MAKIKFVKGFPSIEVRPRIPLMHILLKAGRPVASSCGGEGICGRCRVRILEGQELLPPLTTQEKDVMKRLNIDTSKERLSCQIKVSTDITIDTDYW